MSCVHEVCVCGGRGGGRRERGGMVLVESVVYTDFK